MRDLFDLSDCTLCPRNCHADRLHGSFGFCGQTAELKAARAALHYWEEPCLVGSTASGAVFFSGCSLGCVYCQNRNIAVGDAGKNISRERLTEIFLELQEQKAQNINLVTAGHFLPQILPALDAARAQGLHIPVVYNTGSYEKAETIRRLEGYVDIYLPDLKYLDPASAARYSYAEDYPDTACAAIREMVRQVGAPVFGAEDDSVMTRGVIVRHLVLPGQEENAKQVIRYLYETYGNDIFISILNQYTPMPAMEKFPELNRTVTSEAYDAIVDFAIEIGVENGFIQEGETAKDSFIPEFDHTGI